jgi:hypothetical protein
VDVHILDGAPLERLQRARVGVGEAAERRDRVAGRVLGEVFHITPGLRFGDGPRPTGSDQRQNEANEAIDGAETTRTQPL